MASSQGIPLPEPSLPTMVQEAATSAQDYQLPDLSTHTMVQEAATSAQNIPLPDLSLPTMVQETATSAQDNPLAEQSPPTRVQKTATSAQGSPLPDPIPATMVQEAATSAPGDSMPKPEVVLLSLEYEPDYAFETYNEHLLQNLMARAEVQDVTERFGARSLFAKTPRPVVIAVDTALAKVEYADLLAGAIQFVRSGGTIVFCKPFDRPVDFREIGNLFLAFDLPWFAGCCYRTDFQINPAMNQIDTSNLVPRYSQRAVQLYGVHDCDVVYRPAPGTRVTVQPFSMPHAEPEQYDRDHTACAFGKVRLGNVGFVGDVNAEEHSTSVILAMCGLPGIPNSVEQMESA